MSDFENINISVSEELDGQRLDRYIHDTVFKDFSRSDVQKLITDGAVLINQKTVKKNHKLRENQEINIIDEPAKPMTHVKPEKMDLDIVYEDDDIVVINKPRNLVVHPGSGNIEGTLAAGLLYHYRELSTLNGTLRPGIVHRLDKDTPGLMVAARNDFAHLKLSEALQNRDIERIYNCICWGHLSDQQGVIDVPVGRCNSNRLKMAVTMKGRNAITHYRVKEHFAFASFLSLKLETGRTHQIRVHLNHIQHPVMGDPTYNGREESANRVEPLQRQLALQVNKLCPAQMLQAVKLSFNHPRTGEYMTFEVELREDFKKVIKLLRDNK